MRDILQNCMQAEKLHGHVMPNAQVFSTPGPHMAETWPLYGPNNFTLQGWK